MSNIKNPNELLSPPFRDPLNGQPWLRFTRKNLEAVIANIGNEYNLKALAEGYGVEPEALMSWIERNTTAEDIDRAQHRGDSWAKAKEMHDTVERNLNGFASANIEVQPFTMHGKEYPGWYHPIIDDRDRSKAKYLTPDPEGQDVNFWPSVSTGFTKERTGAKHVLDLNPDIIPVRFNQVLHAIAFKEYVHNTAKIFRDDGFRKGISQYYGKEYNEEMDQFLKRVAGNASYDSQLAGKVTRRSQRPPAERDLNLHRLQSLHCSEARALGRGYVRAGAWVSKDGEDHRRGRG